MRFRNGCFKDSITPVPKQLKKIRIVIKAKVCKAGPLLRLSRGVLFLLARIEAF